MTDKEKLTEIIGNGIVRNIFDAEQSVFLLQTIGSKADQLNQQNYGVLFGNLQRMLVDQLILTVNRLYEEEKSYRLRSIPSAIKVLEKKSLQISSPSLVLVKHLLVHDWQLDSRDVANLDQAKLLDKLIKTLRGCLPVVDSDASLKALKTIRDKAIAHPEDISVTALPSTKLAEVERLLSYAKAFVGIVGYVFLEEGYIDREGTYLLSVDAERSSVALRRLFEQAGIL